MAIDWLKARSHVAESERTACTGRPELKDFRKVLRERRRRLAAGRGEREAIGRRVSLLVCTLAGERYGFETAGLLQVVQLPAVTAIRGGVRGLLGVFSWGGELRSIHCARRALGLDGVSRIEVGDYVLIPRISGGGTALRVDVVNEIVQAAETAIDPWGPEGKGGSEHVRGRTRDGVSVVDLASLLRSQDVATEERSRGAHRG